MAGQLPLPFSRSFKVLWDSLHVAQLGDREPLHIRSFTASCQGHQFAANEETGRGLMQASCRFIFLQLYMFLPSTYYTLIG